MTKRKIEKPIKLDYTTSTVPLPDLYIPKGMKAMNKEGLKTKGYEVISEQRVLIYLDGNNYINFSKGRILAIADAIRREEASK